MGENGNTATTRHLSVPGGWGRGRPCPRPASLLEHCRAKSMCPAFSAEPGGPSGQPRVRTSIPPLVSNPVFSKILIVSPICCPGTNVDLHLWPSVCPGREHSHVDVPLQVILTVGRPFLPCGFSGTLLGGAEMLQRARLVQERQGRPSEHFPSFDLASGASHEVTGGSEGNSSGEGVGAGRV